MIYRRVAARLKAQDWVAITIELGIVIIGVFVGTWVASWNQQRVEQRETRELLVQLKPELVALDSFSHRARAYYALTQRYARTAFAGWNNDPRVSDHDFVVAAYQASQIYGFGNNGQSWAMIFGGETLRKIRDPQIRTPLTRLMTFDYQSLNYAAVTTQYRDDVRKAIPEPVQELIRRLCGDRLGSDSRTLELPQSCVIPISAAQAHAAAQALRAQPELAQELALHQSAVSTYETNLDQFDVPRRQLYERISLLK
jgi:hypothetical protein